MKGWRCHRFSGRLQDWREFASEWGEWHDLQKEASPDLTDQAFLKFLSSALDKASQDLLRAAKKEDPYITFAEFWEKLEGEFVGDVDAYYRKKWESVSLHGATSLDTLSWRRFVAEFRLARDEVGDISEKEAEMKLEKELPKWYRVELKKEKLARQRTQFWVKVVHPPTISLNEIARFVGGGFGPDPGAQRGRFGRKNLEL